MTRKSKVTLSAQQKLEYAKLMVEEGYTNKQIGRDVWRRKVSSITLEATISI